MLKVGIFYDPMPDCTEEQLEELRTARYSEDALKKFETEQKEKAKGLLREQIIDFLNWLKGQGII